MRYPLLFVTLLYALPAEAGYQPTLWEMLEDCLSSIESFLAPPAVVAGSVRVGRNGDTLVEYAPRFAARDDIAEARPFAVEVTNANYNRLTDAIRQACREGRPIKPVLRQKLFNSSIVVPCDVNKDAIGRAARVYAWNRRVSIPDVLRIAIVSRYRTGAISDWLNPRSSNGGRSAARALQIITGYPNAGIILREDARELKKVGIYFRKTPEMPEMYVDFTHMLRTRRVWSTEKLLAELKKDPQLVGFGQSHGVYRGGAENRRPTAVPALAY